MAKKRGRPKNIINDMGTPELQRLRVTLSYTDPTLSTCPLDVLLARKHISPEAHAAAVHFRACRARMFGSPHLKAVDLNEKSGFDFIGDADQAERRYREACQILAKYSRAHLDAVENIVVHERWPRWLFNACGKAKAKFRDLEAIGVLMTWNMRSERAA